ncbi:hypothetical protein [Streptococcus oricebi]|uniref:LXG domain-containing protein n=1 Tax=Streptococcus oricebi TaxID=1547447 RepID=A0ABS5B744_9STRE|nr:hypothetical protein [Streptococcus oricebi]MBP2624333.1 hypothetical protein [Streptococcus oricebi]
MAVVQINSKSGLDGLGKVISEAGDQYNTAISEVTRSLDVKTDNQEGSAIEAFEAKLNQIAGAVFEQYPQLLKDYGKAVSEYVSEIEGIGFSSETLRTKATPINHIKKWLTTDTYNGFKDLKKDLDTEFKAVIEALAMSPHSVDEPTPNLNDALSTAKSGLDKAGKTRRETHDKLVAALDTFKGKLDSVQTGLTGILASLKNAEFINGLPATEVVALIAQGSFKAEDMNDIDVIQAEGDGAALIALHSPDKFNKLGQVNPTNVSDPMMTLIYKLFYNEVKPEVDKDGNLIKIEVDKEGNVINAPSLKNIEAFLASLTKQDVSRVKAYTEKLVKAGDRLGLVMLGQGIEMTPDFPKNGTVEELAKYTEELAKASPNLKELNMSLQRAAALTGLFEGVYALEMGRDARGSLHGKDEVSYYSTIRPGSLKFGGPDRIRFENELYENGKWRAKTTAEVLHYRQSKGIAADKLVNTIAELQEKRNKAALEFVKNLTQETVSLIPGASAVNVAIDVANNIAGLAESPNLKNGAKLAGKGTPYLPEKWKGAAGFSTKTAEWLGNYVETMQNLSKQSAETQEALKSNLFDIGGINVNYGNSEKPENKVVRYAPEYDLQSALEIHDLEQNGLRGYIYRTEVEKAQEEGASIDKAIKTGWDRVDGFEKASKNSQTSRAYTAKVKNFLAGEGNGQVHLEVEKERAPWDFLPESKEEQEKRVTVSEFWNGIKEATGSTGLASYLGDGPDGTLNNLAGHYSHLIGD